MTVPHPLAGRQRVLVELSRQLWRALAGAGPRGIGEPDLLSKLHGLLDRDTLNRRLHQLQSCGYCQRSGLRFAAVWTATAKVPLGEDAPSWQQDADQDADEDPAPRAAPAGPEAGAAASIFDVGDRDISPDWGWPAKTGQNKAAIAKAAMQMSSSSKPPAAKTQAPLTLKTLTFNGQPLLAKGKPVVMADPAQAKPLPEPIFELHSDGILVLDLGEGEPEGQVVLPPRVTRALFRWLDRLGGTGLRHLLPGGRT